MAYDRAGVIGAPMNSSFIAGSAYNDDIKQANAIVAMKKLPCEERVKFHTKYHHCGE
jgi:hypothetical protein